MGNPQWSQDSEYLYVSGFDNDELVRIRRADGKSETMVDLKTANPNSLDCHSLTVASNGELWLACPVAYGDIYALDVSLPRVIQTPRRSH